MSVTNRQPLSCLHPEKQLYSHTSSVALWMAVKNFVVDWNISTSNSLDGLLLHSWYPEDESYRLWCPPVICSSAAIRTTLWLMQGNVSNLHDMAQHFCPDIHRAQRMNPYVLLNHLICWDTTKCYYDFDIIYHQIWCQRCTIAAVYDAYVINVFNHFSSIKVKLNHTALFMH